VQLTGAFDKGMQFFDARLNVSLGYQNIFFTIASEGIPVPASQRVG
jgi:hypothetical protein